MLNKILFVFLILFSLGLFFINDLSIIVGLLIVSILLSIIFKVRLPIYIPFIILLVINFVFNYLFSDMYDALLVTLRLVIMFIAVNLIIKKIGITNIGQLLGSLFRSKSLELMISISLSFIPIMSKELKGIRDSLKTKNFSLNFINIIKRPHIFVITFFTNLFRRVNDMEKVFISRGIDE